MRVVPELRAVDVNSSHRFEEETGTASSENGLRRQDAIFDTGNGQGLDNWVERFRGFTTQKALQRLF